MAMATDVGFVEMRIAKVIGVSGAEDQTVRCVARTGERHRPAPVGVAAYRVRVSTTSWLYRPPHQADTATCPGPDDTLQVRRKLPSPRAVAGVSCPTLAVLG
jgi:hypothetical protein